METRPIFVLLGILAAAGALAEAYTWTDEDGVVHYSDRPQPGATVVELETSSTSRPQTNARASAPSNDGEPEPQEEFSYESLEIGSPAAEETLWNIGGTLNVSLNLTPALQSGHQVRVYFDGTPQTVPGTSFTLQEVHRGVHNLQAEVIDETGQLMIRSRPSRFYVQQNSIL